MSQKTFLVAALFFTTISLCILLEGCGGGTSSPTTDSGANTQSEGSDYAAYIFGPASSGQSLFKLYNLADTSTEDGILILDSPDQAPAGYEPIEGCRLILPDGTEARTDSSGWFRFTQIPFNRSERGIPLIVDPQESNHPRLAKLIVPLIVPRARNSFEFTNNGQGQDLRLIIKPASLLLSKGARFLYRAFLVDDRQGAVYQLLPSEVSWSVSGDGGRVIGNIASSGLFQASGLGKGQVVARAVVNSQQMTAWGEIEIVDRLQVSRIYGQVTDAFQHPVAGAIIFVAGFENGVITNAQGSYLIPSVPTGESLTLTFIYRGIVIKTLNGVVVEHGEAKEINVSLDTFQETGEIFSHEGRLILAVEGLQGPLSTDEFPKTKEYELLGVAEVEPNLYQQLKQDESLGFWVIIEGLPILSSTQGGEGLPPQVKVTSLKILSPSEQNLPVQTLQGEISWQDDGQQVYFRGQPGRGVILNQLILNQLKVSGIEKFPLILKKLQDFSGRWFAAKLIGQIDRSSHSITLFQLSLVETFFQQEGEISYDPQILPGGAILMTAGNSQIGLENPPSSLDRSYLLLNVQAVSPQVYNLLVSYANQGFPGEISGIKIDDPNYALPLIQVCRIQLFSKTKGYLLHRRGEIWSDEQGQIRFSLSLPIGDDADVYLLDGVSQFEEIQLTLEQFPGRRYLCFLSGEISQGAEEEEIVVSQIELLGPAKEQSGTGSGLQGDGIVYYKLESSLPIGGRYLYQKFINGRIDSEVYELSNIRPGSEIADLLKSRPGLIVQVSLNYSNPPVSGQQQNNARTGPPRLIVNQIDILKNVDPLFQVSGELIYHSWEDMIELVATSPAFPEGTRQSFILESVPNDILLTLLTHPDRFMATSGIIQVFQPRQLSILEPLKAKALELVIEENLDLDK